MKISDFLEPADALIDVGTPNKQQLLQMLAHKAATTLGLQAEDIASGLLKREDLGSTGMGRGVAIPHARSSVVKKPYGIIARLKPRLDFDAIDAEPVDLVFMLLLPAPSESDQLTALALVARKLKSPDTLTRLRQAKHAPEFYAAIVDG